MAQSASSTTSLAVPDGSGLETASAVRVRYAETDKMGVVYYSNYLVWFEVGRCDWLRSRGRSYSELEAAGLALPVVEAHCEYRQPARYDDELDIRTTAALLSPVRVEFRYAVVRRCDGRVAALGHTVHAVIDRNGRPCRLPHDVRELFS
jgi:acyl-CoA thioester hydrolase